MTDEQIKALIQLKDLKEQGILSQEEFEKEKAEILQASAAPKQQPAASTKEEPAFNYLPLQTRPKKKNSTLWIILGAVAAVIVIVAIALGSSSGDYSGSGSYGILSNRYDEIDTYLEYNYDGSYREGNTVYYREFEDIPGLEIIGGVIRNPDVLALLFGDDAAAWGGFVSGGLRESALRYLIQEDYTLMQLIAANNLSLSYSLNDTQLFVYSAEEIKAKMNY